MILQRLRVNWGVKGCTRDIRPLLTVETKVNRGLKEYLQMKGFFPWLVRWAYRAGTRDFCYALSVLVGPVPYTILIPVSPTQRKLGRQPCWVACLSLYVSGVHDANRKIKWVDGRVERGGGGGISMRKSIIFKGPYCVSETETHLEGSILESTQVKNTAVGTGLSRT